MKARVAWFCALVVVCLASMVAAEPPADVRELKALSEDLSASLVKAVTAAAHDTRAAGAAEAAAKAKQRLREMQDQMDADFAAWDEGKQIKTPGFRRPASMIRCAWQLEMEICALEVEANRQDIQNAVKDLDARRRGRKKAIDAMEDTARRDAELINLDTGIRRAEEKIYEEAQQRHEALAKRLNAARENLCGEQWRWVDICRRRDRPNDADYLRRELYLSFANGLEHRDRGFYQVMFPDRSRPQSELDYFLQSQKGLITFSPLSLKVALAEKWRKGLNMRETLAARVEDLKRFDHTIPPVEASGTAVEAAALVLEKRLNQLAALDRAAEKAHEQLESVVASAKVSSSSLDGFRDIADAMTDLADRQERAAASAKRIEEAQRAVRAVKGRIDRAERSLELADKDLFVENDKVSRDPQGESYAAITKRLRELMEASRAQGGTGETFAKRAGSLEAGRDQLVQPLRQAMEDARAERRKADQDLQRAGAEAQEAPADSERTRLAQRFDLVRVEINRAGEARVTALEDGAAGLRKGALQMKAAVNALDLQMTTDAVRVNQLVDEIVALDRFRISLVTDISRQRQAASFRAMELLKAMGADPQDDKVMRVLQAAGEGFAESSAVLDKVDLALSQTGQAVDMAHGFGASTVARRAEAAEIVDRLSAHVERIADVAGRVDAWRGHAETLVRLKTVLGNKEDPLKALSDYLTIANEVTGKMSNAFPLLGVGVGNFLTFYANAASAASSAMLAIEQKLVERSIPGLFNPPPERKLYREAEIKSLLSGRLGDASLDKAVNVIQLRRLIFLLHSDP